MDLGEGAVSCVETDVSAGQEGRPWRLNPDTGLYSGAKNEPLKYSCQPRQPFKNHL